jgi:hypothetical protein
MRPAFETERCNRKSIWVWARAFWVDRMGFFVKTATQECFFKPLISSTFSGNFDGPALPTPDESFEEKLWPQWIAQESA